MTELEHISKSRIVWIGHQRLPSDWRIPAHGHSFYELIVVIQGKTYVEMCGQKIHGTMGDLLFYPRDCPHLERADDPGSPLEKYYLGWDGPDFGAPLLTHDRDGRARMLIQWLYEEWLAAHRKDSAVILSLFAALISEVARLARYTERTFVQDVRAFVRDNIDRAFRVEELARIANMSKYHFIREYKTLTGRTPMEDVRMLRIETAKKLIITTDMPLRAVADKVGVSDEYHLSKMFKKYLDLPPGYFRSK
ncbi:MAG: helix-turn-helix domain-containing protein [Kiritimatiellae bacterium]|nr:helix-turn-helix domain-containing protein [Kiritimatiellia bacterium]